ncbi:MAG: hypothetical protein OXC40_07865 [Proteobacteria bacterium]|nr:hypothetical protein [Pseudomonadota bacterium]
MQELCHDIDKSDFILSLTFEDRLMGAIPDIFDAVKNFNRKNIDLALINTGKGVSTLTTEKTEDIRNTEDGIKKIKEKCLNTQQQYMTENYQVETTAHES